MATTAETLRLRAAGFTDEQIEALGAFVQASVATKADVASVQVEIARLRTEVAGLRGEIYRAMGVQTLAILAAVFAMLRYVPLAG